MPTLPPSRAVSSVLVSILCAVVGATGCGGSRAEQERAPGQASHAARASSGDEDPRPPLDRRLAATPRTDPPPFPVTDFVQVASPMRSPLPADRLALIASFIRWYEQDPYDPAINRWGQGPISTRAAMLMWVTESPDVSVIVSPVLGPMAAQRGEDAELIGALTTMGSMLGMAAHAIEHPDLDPHDPVRQAAGIESALRWYESAVRRGAPRSAFLDELIGVRDRGELAAWFAARVHFDE
jgi:hypothetical protein